MAQRDFEPGDWVIYKKVKYSERPGPRAREIAPCKLGDSYSYVVDKFWVVIRPPAEDGTLVLGTRRGKELRFKKSDPNLHRANFWERLIHRSRFPQLTVEAS